jgi:hypothetical protein
MVAREKSIDVQNGDALHCLLTGGDVAAVQRSAIAAMANVVARVIAPPFISFCDCCVETKSGTIRST